MALPRTHRCTNCANDTASGTALHEDIVVGAPLSMEDLDDAQRHERFARKYAMDGCRVTEVRKVPSDTHSGYAWSVRFVENH